MNAANLSDADRQALRGVPSGDVARAIFHALDDGTHTPTEVADRTGCDRHYAGQVLARLADAGCAELLVPEERRKGRRYGITERGQRVLAVLPGENDGE